MTPYAFDSTAREKLLKHNFYYSDFEEKAEEINPQKHSKPITDSLFFVGKYEKDTVDYYKGAYEIVFKDSLLMDKFPAFLIDNADTLQVNFEKKKIAISHVKHKILFRLI